MQTQASTSTALDEWLTFNDFPKSHPNFKRSQIEWLYRNRDQNGMATAFRRIGKLKYVHAGRFAELLLEGRGR